MGVHASRGERTLLVWAGRCDAAAWQYFWCARRAGLQRRQCGGPRRLRCNRIVDACFEEDREPDQPGDTRQILRRRREYREGISRVLVRHSLCAFNGRLTAKGGVIRIGVVRRWRGHGFYGKHLDAVIRRELLAFDLDLLTFVTCQRARVRNRPRLPVFRDEAFSVLTHPTGDGDGFGCAGFVAAAALTGDGHGQQERDSKKGEFFHRELSSGPTL